MADHELLICHDFFGMARSHSDINVIQPCSKMQLRDQYDHQYIKGYYLADGKVDTSEDNL
jgi:hypothetical protein